MRTNVCIMHAYTSVSVCENFNSARWSHFDWKWSMKSHRMTYKVPAHKYA